MSVALWIIPVIVGYTAFMTWIHFNDRRSAQIQQLKNLLARVDLGGDKEAEALLYGPTMQDWEKWLVRHKRHITDLEVQFYRSYNLYLDRKASRQETQRCDQVIDAIRRKSQLVTFRYRPSHETITWLLDMYEQLGGLTLTSRRRVGETLGFGRGAIDKKLHQQVNAYYKELCAFAPTDAEAFANFKLFLQLQPKLLQVDRDWAKQFVRPAQWYDWVVMHSHGRPKVADYDGLDLPSMLETGELATFAAKALREKNAAVAYFVLAARDDQRYRQPTRALVGCLIDHLEAMAEKAEQCE